METIKINFAFRKMRKLTLMVGLFAFLRGGAQVYDFSGTWSGTITYNVDSTTSKVILKLQLIDSCNLIYRVEQIQIANSINHGNHIGYNFIQFNNILIRDGMTYYKDYDSKGGRGGLAHLKIEYKNGMLYGIRTSRDSYINYDIFELYNTNKLKLIKNCKTETSQSKPVIKKLGNCANSKVKPVFIDTIIVNKNDMVSIGISDDNSEDEDKITLFSGNKQVLLDAPIYNTGYNIPFKITNDTLITWCACNQGKKGLNTGLFTITYGDLRRDIEVHLKNNERVSFFVKIKEEETKIQVKEWHKVGE